jgi:hypothetical protein
MMSFLGDTAPLYFPCSCMLVLDDILGEHARLEAICGY